MKRAGWLAFFVVVAGCGLGTEPQPQARGSDPSVPSGFSQTAPQRGVETKASPPPTSSPWTPRESGEPDGGSSNQAGQDAVARIQWKQRSDAAYAYLRHVYNIELQRQAIHDRVRPVVRRALYDLMSLGDPADYSIQAQIPSRATEKAALQRADQDLARLQTSLAGMQPPAELSSLPSLMDDVLMQSRYFYGQTLEMFMAMEVNGGDREILKRLGQNGDANDQKLVQACQRATVELSKACNYYGFRSFVITPFSR